MARERYHAQLDLLRESVSSLGEMAEFVFNDSMDAVINLDVELAKKTLALEPKMDSYNFV